MTTDLQQATAELSTAVDSVLRLHDIASDGVASATKSELEDLVPRSSAIPDAELDDELRYWASAFDSSIVALRDVRAVLDRGGYTDIAAVRRARIPVRYVLSMLRERVGELVGQRELA